MSKNKKLEQEQLKQQKTKRRNRIIIGSIIAVCAVVVLIILVNLSQASKGASVTGAIDENGDLRIPKASIQRGLNYLNFGGMEELIIWENDSGEIKTALDTCEECYLSGNVHFTLTGKTIICNVCGTSQPVSVLGTASWGGCQPVAIVEDIREDTDAEIVVPAEVLTFANNMLYRWATEGFVVDFSSYGIAE